MAVRLSGLATSALSGSWPGDPQRRPLDNVQASLHHLEAGLQVPPRVYSHYDSTAPLWSCWVEGTAP
eukprot:11173943-Heterocapsa_arctica.AAC.1